MKDALDRWGDGEGGRLLSFGSQSSWRERNYYWSQSLGDGAFINQSLQ